MMISRFMSIRQVAKETGLSEFFLRSLVRTGKVPVIKSGNKYMINMDKFNELMEEMQTQGSKDNSGR